MIKSSISSIFEFLIPSGLKKERYIHIKAIALTSIHLFVISICFILMISSRVFHTNFTEGVPIEIGVVVLGGLIYLFKRYGNLVLSGNLLAFLWAAVLTIGVYETGGLYSDNLLWLLIAPLIGLLFANRMSGLIWGMYIIAITTHTYFMAVGNNMLPQDQIPSFSPDYYYGSYTLLFVTIIGIILIFEKNKAIIIEQLHQKNDELEEQKKILEHQKIELQHQAEELRLLSAELKSSNQDLEHFAYAASHDLKEPLRMIKSYLGFIQKDQAIQASASSQEFMNYATKGADRMERLLTDLLNYSRVGRVNLESTPIDLNDILLVVCNNLMAKINSNQVEVLYNNLPIVLAPQTLLIQLFQNLISNGIKFQQANSRPIIQIAAVNFDKEVMISIKDNGIGIAKENQEKVFSIFQRLHTQEEYEGSGIGLHTCKKIIDNIGGKIWLQSEMGKGTTFFVTLPNYQHNEMKAGQAKMNESIQTASSISPNKRSLLGA